MHTSGTNSSPPWLSMQKPANTEVYDPFDVGSIYNKFIHACFGFSTTFLIETVL